MYKLICIVVLMSAGARASDLFCENADGTSVSVSSADGALVLAINDMGGMKLAKAVGLPNAHRTYTYTVLNAALPQDGCQHSASNPILSLCKGNSGNVTLVHPRAVVPDTSIALWVSKHTEESFMGGTSSYYEVHLTARPKSLTEASQQVWRFGLSECR